MKNLFKKILYLFIVLTLLSACQAVKDGLTGKKQNNQDEFLVEKKNPLVLPPDFNILPEPKTLNETSSDQEKIDLKSILSKNIPKIKTTTTSKITNNSLEKSILEKIKSN
jgi:hypothetical protein